MGVIIDMFEYVRRRIKKVSGEPDFLTGDTVIGMSLGNRHRIKGFVCGYPRRYEDIIGMGDFKGYKYSIREYGNTGIIYMNVSEDSIRISRMLLSERNIK